ncbi:hypothetical protein PF010_g14705 [Phytophthora fragariae]|nr:hypothetical protein PF009_g16446 [Phytophthora fragariae]KAE9000439.1 hypothetical protein PF011_g14173 [Phytophthora fragariae]KAE9100727.1 hypothetical protein PF010_g14705 [Phytophthora fragariae]KAE9137228.1 hypothetical protein PF006_g14224 [Phytophthora fragariae]KAE9218259.1 hypothetical protein PF002_g16554 [Phytophthora fragariae]
MAQSSHETLLSPQSEYLHYVLEVIVPVSEGYKGTLQRCSTLLELNVVQRILSAVILAPLVTAFLWLSPAFATSTVCSFVASACSYEYACLSNRIRLRILTRLEALEGILDEDTADPRWSSEVRLRSNRSSFLSSQTAEEDAMSDGNFLSRSLACESSTSDGAYVGLRPSQTDLRSRQEEQEEEDIARVDAELRAQEDRLRSHAVSHLATCYFYGNEKLAAGCLSVVVCALSSTLFLLSVEHAQALQSTEFYEFRWFYSIATSYVAGFCACMAPDWSYALTILVQTRVEALLTLMLDVLGLFYIAGTLSILVAFVDDERRVLYRELLIALLYIVWASDTGAYVTGKALELVNYPYYNPLAAHLSRNKDYEGTIGAIAFGIGATVVLSQVLDLPGSFALKAVFTVMAVIIGRLGDLFESLLKRAAGVKDSGKLIPGHGGMLDRIDALMFATVVFSRYYAMEN